ncbi:MAG: topoisomerase IV, partial [Clostridia bacterium]|nr:topoisomerase IV [Clostridia bacterium]
KFKEGDSLFMTCETMNSADVLVFSDKCQVYKMRVCDFDDGKASALGDYLPGKLGFDEGESFFAALLPGDYSGNILFAYENGKAAKVALSGYATKTNRRKLTGAYCDKSVLKSIINLQKEEQIAFYSSDGRVLVASTAQIAVKTTRSTQGVSVMTLKKKAVLDKAVLLEKSSIVNASRYRTKTIPAAGAALKDEDMEEKQIMLEL